MDSSRVIVTFTAFLPIFNFLICTQGQTLYFELHCLIVIYPLKASGYYMYRQFKHSKFCVLISRFFTASCSTLVVRNENAETAAAASVRTTANVK